jgi:hypothetical protein
MQPSIVRRSSNTRAVNCFRFFFGCFFSHRDIPASVRRPLHDCAPVASPDVIRGDGLRKAAMPEGKAI